MTVYKRGEIVLVPFPYTDLSTSKKRPVVILSSDRFNSSRQDCIVAPITGRVLNAMIDDYTLNDWASAGLLKPSIVKAILATVHQKIIISRLGCISDADLKKLAQNIASVLEIRP